MITRSTLAPASAPSPPATPAGTAPAAAVWQRRLGEAVASVGELLDLVGVDAAALDACDAAGCDAAYRDFPLRVPRPFVARMRRGDPRDPLLRQVLPSDEELRPVPGFGRDPLAEAAASPVPGVLHKYRGRVLLVATGACAVHCRYCFRRHFPYLEHAPSRAGWERAVAYVAADPTIAEVILSGGDPLSLHDGKLAALAADLAAIPHLRRLRLHTRLPIVLPERVDDALLGWLGATPLQRVVVVHVNHAAEIDGEVVAAMARLRRAGVTLLNQSVLLRGVNDDAAALGDLSESLFAAGVLPYYLHLVDRVAGAAHFEVEEAAARTLVRQLLRQLPGYLVPRLVREVPGVPNKWPVPLVDG